MNDPKFDEERLTELQEELKAVPAEERDAVYEEMVTDGAFNPFAEDDDPHALITQLKDDENDSPRSRIVDYLLAFLPLIATPFVVALLNMPGAPTWGWYVWSFGLFALLFAFIGYLRRSKFLTVYWLGAALGQIGIISSIMDLRFAPIRVVSAISIIVGVLVLAGIGRLIHKNRHDNLFTAFAVLPIVSELIWTFGSTLIFRYISIDQMMGLFAVRSLISIVLTGISLGLIFLGRQRGTKWMGIFLSVFTTIISQLMLVLVGFSAFSMPALLILAAMALVTIGVPAFFFWRDGRTQEKQPDEFTAEPTML